ncbi:MAG: hypothetical protein ACREP9_19240 [Candidatus Dormibacteraceae bacterium]
MMELKAEEAMIRIAASALVLGSLVAGILVDQSMAASPPTAGYVGQGASSVAGCPYLIWRLTKHADGAVTGIVYYSDLSGVSMAKGNVGKSGQFHIELTSEMGEGPVGTVDGLRPPNGKATATMKGPGCANMEIRLTPVDNLNQIPLAAQTPYKQR